MPFRASPYGRGRDEWVAHTVRARRPARDRVPPGDGRQRGNTVTQTVARLDLRDPANLALARPLFESKQRWTAVGGAGKQAVMDRIATHGVVEHTVSDLDDDSSGASFGSAAAGSSGSAARGWRSTSGSSARRACAARSPARGWIASGEVARHVPRPELDEVAVGIVDVGGARVLVGRRTRARRPRAPLARSSATAAS